MDVYGCSQPNTRLDGVLLVIALVVMALCVAVGIPFLFLVAAGIIA